MNSQSLSVICTIGVYGTTSESFFSTLREAGIDCFVDIRQRRAVRGSKYAYVNSTALQNRLAALGIHYVYIKGLAPTADIRLAQKKSDSLNKTTKHARTTLSPEFSRLYTNCCLEVYDASSFLASLPPGTAKPVLFCVENPVEACHRGLAASYLAKELNLNIIHL